MEADIQNDTIRRLFEEEKVHFQVGLISIVEFSQPSALFIQK